MRIERKILGRDINIVVAGLLASLLIAGCHKRNDGLVFDDVPAQKKSKSEKSSKEAKATSEPKSSKEPKDSGESKSSKKDSKESKKSSSKSGSKGKGDIMYGRVVDRNDQPLKRVTVLVTPGNTEIVTSKWGEYEIDSLHTEDGSKLNLKKGTDYTINAWKPGYHETSQIFRYDGASQEIPTITLIEDSIKLEPQDTAPLVPTKQDDETGSGAAGKSVENE